MLDLESYLKGQIPLNKNRHGFKISNLTYMRGNGKN